jgi:acetyl-CoA acetyltransferase
MSESAVIVGFARSPFTPANKGQLAKTRPDDLVAEVIKALAPNPFMSKEIDQCYRTALKAAARHMDGLDRPQVKPLPDGSVVEMP